MTRIAFASNQFFKTKILPLISLPGKPLGSKLEDYQIMRRYVSTALLILMLMIHVAPTAALSTLWAGRGAPELQTGSTLTFAAVDDASLVKGSPDTNYGSAATLQVDKNTTSHFLLKFNVTGINSRPVTSAKVRLYNVDPSSKGGDFYRVGDNSWQEETLTWNNAPAADANRLAALGSVSANAWVEIDLTSLIQNDGVYSLRVSSTSTNGADYSSKEGANPPQLVITLGSNTPTATQPSAGTATATRTPASTTNTPTAPPVTATQMPGSANTFIAEADAQVNESSPSANYGSSTYMQIDGAADPGQEGFIRFTVTGLSGSVQGAKLRVYDTTNASANGPAVYGTGTSWTETGITWNNRPARITNELDNKGSIGTAAWVEYDVSALVTGNGTFSFVLVADSNDAATFSSRQGSQPPQLVITTGGGSSPTSTVPPNASPTPIPSSTPSGNSVVLVGAGDISRCNNNNDELTAQLLDNIPGTVFTLGDNVYDSGTYTEYTNCYDPTWGRHKARTKPVPGNHEYNTSGAAGYFQYFNNIPAYYAYDLGTWRIYALNSEIDVSASGAQVAWLQADLAANPRACVLAYWHKPRWSSGSSHGSNSAMQTLWQVLYNAGAELVLSGHEHNYERFAEMNASGSSVSQGLREIVVGTGGASLYGFGTPLSSSQVRGNTAYGVLKLTLNSDRYDWQFVPVAGSTFTDSGTTNCH